MVMELDLTGKWLQVRNALKKDYQIKPDLDGILFIIGIQELGILKEEYSKDEKQDLMHIAVCSILSKDGYYESKGVDKDNWPIWNQTKSLPVFNNSKDQEQFLKQYIIHYFEQQNYI